MSDGGKGSAPRPFSVDKKTFNDNYDQIFKKSKPCDKNCISTECPMAQMGTEACCKEEASKSSKD